ncbi:MAG: hypothetical protein JSV05_01985 [Candidatus Bathyarchaeota archaeon]|nr:MAG: hypothetical protein JSV05_01985 [Candidatus Bathyarchaeota archaeon]
MDVKLLVDEEEILLNEFVKKILGGMISGAVESLRDVTEEWKDVRIEITR